MKLNELLVRCYAERDGDMWFAVCIDFNLATQAVTLEAAKRDLNAQISEYLHDALFGEDREFAAQLLNRKAPWQYRAKYYLIKFKVMRLVDLLAGHSKPSEALVSFNPHLAI
ncbi:MAG: hypothetical protein WBJ75_12525 [Pseudohongiellaceae bacterium]